MSLWKKLLWVTVTLLGLASLAVLALSRGEQISALWIIVAGLCGAAISYRFYSKWIATKILVLNDERATPAIVRNDGKDFVPTNRWMVFGHHFAAIAGAGPLVGPTLAAQFGFAPGFLWIVFGAVLSVFGIVVALLITGTTLSIIAYLGAIIGMGIVHKNGILMLDYTEHLRAGGMELGEALVQSGRRRLRPVLMTSFAAALGMLPLAYGVGSGADMLRPLAIAVAVLGFTLLGNGLQAAFNVRQSAGAR